jgi:hypothetical protein
MTFNPPEAHPSLVPPAPRKLIYIAGPYRAARVDQREINIQNAWRAAARVAELGAMPVCPHANSAHLDDLQPADFWLEGTLELMRRCDGVLLLQGWEDSAGSRGELREAAAKGLPVFITHFQLRLWLRGRYTPGPIYTNGLLDAAQETSQ